MNKVKYSFVILILLFGLAACDVISLNLSNKKEITAFSFESLEPVVTATIAGTKISAEVPSGTYLKTLVATFSTTGKSVTVGGRTQISGTLANDFTDAVVYRVMAEDGSTQDYSVRVTIAAAVAPKPPKSVSSKEITGFGFLNFEPEVIGTIGGTTITLQFPPGADVKNLVATFTTTGKSVAIDGKTLVSGVTPADFSNGSICRVTAEDGPTKDYTIVVDKIRIGSSYGGGVVFHLYPDGHTKEGVGLIAATKDQASRVHWGSPIVTGASGQTIGTGLRNTEKIVQIMGDFDGRAYAAKIALDYSVKVGNVTYDDWFLPSKDELNEMYKNRAKIGGFSTASPGYWSSSEDSHDLVFGQNFGTGRAFKSLKGTSIKNNYGRKSVRVIRVF